MNQAISVSVSDELLHLLSRRDQLDRAIAALERIRLPGLHLQRRLEQVPRSSGHIGSVLDLSRLTLSRAIETVLHTAAGPMTNAEIVEALIRGRVRFRGMNPPLAVAQGLSRMVQKQTSVKKLARGRWVASSETTVRGAGQHRSAGSKRTIAPVQEVERAL